MPPVPMPIVPEVVRAIECRHCEHRSETVEEFVIHYMANHQLEVNDNMPGRCGACFRVFRNLSALVMHVFSVSRCPSCCKVLCSPRDLRRHYWTHIPRNEWPFECQRCWYRANQWANMLRHNRLMH